MKVFKFLPPYKENGRTNFPETQNRTGVYLIKENGKIVYVGKSGYNLYKTLYRHFQEWNHKYQEVISYKGPMYSRRKYTVRVIYCTPKQANALEKKLIMKYVPRDNTQKYDLFNLPPVEKKYHDQVMDQYFQEDVLNELPY